MRVLIAAVGSRGDVAPFTGLGVALRGAGHHVTIAAYGMFADLVTASGLNFRALPGDPRVLGATEEGQRWQRGGGGPLGVARLVRLIGEHMRDVHAELLAAARDGTDVVLATGQAMPGSYHIAEGLGLPSIGLALQPMHPTGAFPPPAMMTRSLGPWANRIAGRAMLTQGTAALLRASKPLWAGAGLPGFDSRGAYRHQAASRWPVYYGFSPAVVPRPGDWRDDLQVTGYWWPDRPSGWTPPAELEDFLSAGPPPVFIGFGSRDPADADRLNALLAETRDRVGVRMVVQAGWAGLAGDGGAGDVLTIGEVPHDWLFPRMAAVVHHAGAGTTAAGLRAGVPAVTVPLLIDQPFWATRLAAIGVGPAPIAYRRLSSQALAAAITDAVTRDSYRQRAQALARRLSGEDGTRPVVGALDRISRHGSPAPGSPTPLSPPA